MNRFPDEKKGWKEGLPFSMWHGKPSERPFVSGTLVALTVFWVRMTFAYPDGWLDLGIVWTAEEVAGISNGFLTEQVLLLIGTVILPGALVFSLIEENFQEWVIRLSAIGMGLVLVGAFLPPHTTGYDNAVFDQMVVRDFGGPLELASFWSSWIGFLLVLFTPILGALFLPRWDPDHASA